MCRSTAGPLLAMMGLAGTAAGVGLAVVRERLDRRADSRAAKEAAEEQEAIDTEDSRSSDSSDSD
ncbi:MAG: hypothetical protein HOJ22_04895 [Chloroflexi bacterium]|jgi:hypothetical protein|nr:hypothetical protein [Chloroflexota bacterium]MBT5627609.1 hypothetical protein [Chloroflexota bacterium]